MVSEISGNRDCTNHKGETIYYLAHYSKPLLAPTLIGQEEKGTEVSFSLTVRVKLSPLSLSFVILNIEQAFTKPFSCVLDFLGLIYHPVLIHSKEIALNLLSLKSFWI